MMIVIALLVVMAIGGFWLYRKRPASMPVGKSKGAAKHEETVREVGPRTVPDGARTSVNRAPSAESELRDSLLATEVIEVGFDDQVASDLRDGELERAIFLLKQLIQARPGDTGHRMRLFSLLYEERRSDDFVREATDARRMKPSMDARAWVRVCQWGSELDPDNELFNVPGPRPVATSKHEPRSSVNVPSLDSGDAASRGQQASPQLWSGTERRLGKDRRISTSPWLGVERRQADRRRSIRPRRSKARQTMPAPSAEPSPKEPGLSVTQTRERCANG